MAPSREPAPSLDRSGQAYRLTAAILRGIGTGSMDWIQRYGTTMKLMGHATGYTAVEGRGYTYRYNLCVWTSNQGSACSGTISVPVPN